MQEQRLWHEKEATSKAEAGAKKIENGKEPPTENGAEKHDDDKKDGKDSNSKAPDSNGI